ncbi:MAG TPA: glycosyltransferase family protein [Candidatus Limnocylindrales bacterium]|nr:glycosyltransferase family protein [Candidatus Limnocylindrales bacterium]
MKSVIKSREQRIAYFISPHGFGHAARSAAVMQALQEQNPGIQFEIFTRVPAWFFRESWIENFNYHPLLTDIGLVQKTPLIEDLGETVRQLNHLLPFDFSQIQNLAEWINRLNCQLVVCDIAPMGIAVAKEAGIPSVLIENFTWDWIYEGYLAQEPGLSSQINYLQGLFNQVNYRIQTEPVCAYRSADLITPPVSRKVRTPPLQIREKLGISPQDRMVMITMGGIPDQYRFLEELERQHDVYFVIPGAGESLEIRGTLILLPHHSNFYHPDLIHACDAVVGKLGYSTLAEVYYAGVPFGYVIRSKFRESQVLAAYVHRKMRGLAFAETEFQNGNWLSGLSELLALPRIYPDHPNGATQIANFIRPLLDLIGSSTS